MARDISRRDFLNGTALVIAGSLTPLAQLRSQPDRSYPPALTGLRGSNPGSFEVAHQLGREGRVFDVSRQPVDESYDLVVVGGGISGLSAAWFYREQHGPGSRILIIENHDEFGGHARRNEFNVDGRLLIGYGGTQSLERPQATYSAVAKRLIKILGIDLKRFETAFDRNLYRSLGLTGGVFFDRESFGTDRLVRGDPTRYLPGATMSGLYLPAEQSITQFPMSADARQRLIALFKHPRDYLAGKTREQKLEHLRRTSYRDYLRKDVGLGDEAVRYFDAQTIDEMAMGADILPALDAAAEGFMGFDGLGVNLKEEGISEPYIYHFPDGNASIARLLVRDLIPAVAPGHGMEDIVLAGFDYTQLDRDNWPVRLRLNSTAVSVANAKSPGGPVDIGYVTGGRLQRVQARQAVLACYNMMIPHLMPELPKAQRAALSACVKMPLVYTNVAIRNWQAWVKLGVDQIYCPGAFFSNAYLDFPVSLGGYRNPRNAAEPILVHLTYVPLTPNRGYDNVTQFRLGRQKLLETPFETFEKQIIDQLDRMLSGGGFNSSRDIAAITVNRWPHGYAYAEDSLYDKDIDPPLYVTARERCGQVAIANSDAEWNALTSAAIDQAWRAVSDLKG